MRAVAVTRPGEARIVDVPEPKVGPYQARVRTEAGVLCNATDGKLVAGHFPGVDRYPLILGHEGVGIVEEVGEKVRSFRVGDRAVGGLLFEFGGAPYASGWGGFCDCTLVNDHDAMVADGAADAEHGWLECYEIQRAVPPDIPPEAAALLCTWREVYGGIGDFRLAGGDDVLIFGAGPVGLSFLRFGKLRGLGWVGIVDPLESKREKALALGADRVFAPGDPAIAKIPEERGAPLDAVIDAVGRPAIIDQALPLVKLGGTVGVYGVIAEKEITIDKSRGPYNFDLILHQWPTRWREREAQGTLCEWIRAGKVRAADFLTHEFPVEEIGAALEAVGRGEVIKALLRF